MINKWGAILVVAFCLLAAFCAYVAGDRKDQIDDLKKQLVVQNVQLTKQIRQVKADSFRDGLITCGNEDVKYLNERADYYQEIAGVNPLSKLMREWAQTWTYDDATLNEMTESYMDGGTE